MDINFNYTEAGKGAILILLHGNGEDSSYFVHQIEYFKQNFRVIALDTRGHGKTPRGVAPFSIVQFAEDLHDFMDEKGIKKAHILGFSDGGNIALQFVLKYPERVEKLILNGANLYPAGVKPSVQIPIVIGYKIASIFAKKSEEAKKNAQMLGLMINEPNLKPEELHKITAKTLVIAGTRDMIKEKHTRLIAASIPGSRLEILPGDHFVANKNSKEFNSTVGDFLM